MSRLPLLPLSILLFAGACQVGEETDSGKDEETCDGPTATIDPASVSALLGETVTVSGASTVCSGEANLSWNLEQVPAGSSLDNADLDASKGTEISLTPDAVGAYVVSLTVSDSSGGTSNPAYAVINVSAGNSKPTANCGGNQTASEDTRVDFDGSGSSDPEGAALTYDWTLASVPSCSALTETDIYNGSTSTASVVSDCAGFYVVSLVVSDGTQWSDPAYCTLNATSGNSPPVADAGDTTTLSPCTDNNFQLDGFGSYDPEGEALTYRWSLLSAPAGSSTGPHSFDDESLPNPVFTWDEYGSYTIQLEVFDGVQWGTPDVVVYTFQDAGLNTPPVANAGDDQSIDKSPECSSASYVWTCEECESDDVTVDGSASDDPVDGDSLSFYWSELETSELTIQSPFSAVTKIYTPTFAAEKDVEIRKVWEVDLQVSDCSSSDHDTVTITYTCTAEAG